MIYFILDVVDGLIKIGFTTNIRLRLRKLRSQTPNTLKLLGTIPGTRRDEARLHDRFYSKRIWGEWFDISEQQVVEILECTDYIAVKSGQLALPLDEPASASVAALDPEPFIFEIVVQATLRRAA